MTKSLPACLRCPDSETVAVLCETGPHHGSYRCQNCNRFLGWIPAPIDLDRASACEMPFGDFAGSTLGEIVAMPGGLRHLQRLMAWPGLGNGLRRKIEVVLDHAVRKFRHGRGASTRP